VKRKLRFALFVILAVLLVFALDRVSVKLLDREQHIASKAVDEPEELETQVAVKMPSAVQRRWVIPTYPVGDLPVPKPVEKTKKKKSVKKPIKTVKTEKKAPPKKPAKMAKPRQVATKKDGEFPVLEVGYEAIGFAGYLDAIERVGHFFLISNTEQGTEIGTEISLKNRTVYRHRIDFGTLAIKRPHLVSDEMIREQLLNIALPDDVQTDSIILVFTKPFDDLLWDVIENALAKKDLSINQVSRIEGGYVREREDVFLLIRSAENRDTGEKIILNKRLRISLG